MIAVCGTALNTFSVGFTVMRLKGKPSVAVGTVMWFWNKKYTFPVNDIKLYVFCVANFFESLVFTAFFQRKSSTFLHITRNLWFWG